MEHVSRWNLNVFWPKVVPSTCLHRTVEECWGNMLLLLPCCLLFVVLFWRRMLVVHALHHLFHMMKGLLKKAVYFYWTLLSNWFLFTELSNTCLVFRLVHQSLWRCQVFVEYFVRIYSPIFANNYDVLPKHLSRTHQEGQEVVHYLELCYILGCRHQVQHLEWNYETVLKCTMSSLLRDSIHNETVSYLF